MFQTLVRPVLSAAVLFLLVPAFVRADGTNQPKVLIPLFAPTGLPLIEGQESKPLRRAPLDSSSMKAAPIAAESSCSPGILRQVDGLQMTICFSFREMVALASLRDFQRQVVQIQDQLLRNTDRAYQVRLLEQAQEIFKAYTGRVSVVTLKLKSAIDDLSEYMNGSRGDVIRWKYQFNSQQDDYDKALLAALMQSDSQRRALRPMLIIESDVFAAESLGNGDVVAKNLDEFVGQAKEFLRVLSPAFIKSPGAQKYVESLSKLLTEQSAGVEDLRSQYFEVEAQGRRSAALQLLNSVLGLKVLTNRNVLPVPETVPQCPPPSQN